MLLESILKKISYNLFFRSPEVILHCQGRDTAAKRMRSFVDGIMPEWRRPTTESFEAFKKARDVNPVLIENAAKRSPMEVLKSMTQMESNAKECLAKFDLENGLIYYWRATNIGIEFLKRTKLKKGDNIYNRISVIVTFCLGESEKLSPVLENLYVKSAVSKDEKGVATAVHLLKIREKDYELISPRTIVQSLAKSQDLKYLLIDIRESSGEQVRYEPNESALTILNFPKSIFPKGMTLNNMLKILPSQDKHKLHRISEYNVVIVMGRETDEDRESLTAIITAFGVYNSGLKLQKDVCIMEGGFNAWKKLYPPYVSGVTRKQTYVDSDDLTELILNFRKKSSISDQPLYPDISSPSKSPIESVTPPSPTPPPLRDSPPPPIPSIPSTTSTSSVPIVPSISDAKRYPSNGGGIPSEPSLPHSSSSSRISSIVYPTTVLPPASDNQNIPRPSPIPTPRIPNIPGRELKPQSQMGRASAGGSTYSLIPSIDRSDKPSARQAMSPHNRNGLVELYKIVISNTSNASSRGGTRSGFTGLHNNGNTCFMNATLQALFHTTIARKLFTQENFPDECNVSNKMGTNGVMVAAISALFDLMWSGQFQALRITRFISLFSSEVNSTLADGRQHDAHEFQTFLLDSLHEDTNFGQRKGFEQNYKGGSMILAEGADFERKNKGFANSPIQAIFYLQTVSELQCQTCGETSATFEESSCLSLELPSSSSTLLSNSLNNHFSQVTLSGGECWNCPKCRGARPTKRSTAIWRLPPILVIHLKRFSYQGGGYVKNQIDVNFPLNGLDLRNHFHPSSPHRPSTVPYQLYSVTNHTGTLSSGHYTSITNIDGSWVKCDDECLSNYDPRNISPSGSYILFYKNSN
ncbi:usp-50 [Pristionchus pacificus]|nr:usp-50 [Pristionchus pacificus]